MLLAARGMPVGMAASGHVVGGTLAAGSANTITAISTAEIDA